MRQYGAIHGNVYDSDADWLVEKARAVEGRLGDKLVEESIAGEIHPAELRLTDCDAGNCPFCDVRDSTDDAWDEFLQCRVSGPLTYRITEK